MPSYTGLAFGHPVALTKLAGSPVPVIAPCMWGAAPGSARWGAQERRTGTGRIAGTQSGNVASIDAGRNRLYGFPVAPEGTTLRGERSLLDVVNLSVKATDASRGPDSGRRAHRVFGAASVRSV